MSRWLALLALGLSGAAPAADDAALRVVDACRARLDPRSDIGIERIAKRCPELLPALASAPWRELLPQALRERREEITSESLRALADLVRQAGAGTPLRDAPTLEKLHPVLAELGEQGQQGATRWERFKRWLKDKLEKRKDDDDASALEKWSRQFQTSEGIAQAITYIGYAMVGVLVLFVIWSELRAAGLVGGARRAVLRANPAAPWRRRLTLTDIAQAPLADRPGMLLRLLGEALARADRLPAAAGLTAAAIVRRARLDSEAQRAELARVANVADAVRYGNHRPPDEALEGTVVAGRTLLENFARLAAGRALMRERGVAFLLALAALAAFYALWLRPTPSFDPDAEVARPTTVERGGNGYAALHEWLRRSGVEVRSFRERYSKLPQLPAPARGNLLILTLPAVEVFHSDEFSALDQWVRRGNTLLINAALLDQPGWAVRRSSGAVVEIEALTAIEFETSKARAARLDDTPLSERVREADARDSRKQADDEDQDFGGDRDQDAEKSAGAFDAPEKTLLRATGPRALLQGVKTLELETDYAAEEWSLRMPYDNFLLTLARSADGEGALFEQRVGAGRVLLCAGGSLFTNRALGNADNARLFANIVSARMSRDGVVLFDDLRQGLSASYDPARFYRDPRLYKTLLIVLGLWLAWVLGSTRLRAPAIATHDPSEAELVRRAGGLIARTVAPHHTALKLFEHFFAGVARAARRGGGAPSDRGELWHWLERHAAILPQELDRLKTWYADAYSERALPLAALQNFLDTLEKRLKT